MSSDDFQSYIDGDYLADLDEMKDLEFDTVANCCRCGEENLCAYTEDPFLSEVDPEDGPYPKNWWCKVCWEDRKEEV